MTMEDFWLRLYGLSSELHAISDDRWNEMLPRLVAEHGNFPTATRSELKAHLSLLLVRLNQLQSRLT